MFLLVSQRTVIHSKNKIVYFFISIPSPNSITKVEVATLRAQTLMQLSLPMKPLIVARIAAGETDGDGFDGNRIREARPRQGQSGKNVDRVEVASTCR